jgi:hypothetical protein
MGPSPRGRHRASEPAARLDPIEIAVDVELQQDRQIEFVDKDIDYANRIVLADRVHAWMKGELQPPRLQ